MTRLAARSVGYAWRLAPACPCQAVKLAEQGLVFTCPESCPHTLTCAEALGCSCLCEEVCPTSPKAIYTRQVEITNRWGDKVTLQRPYVDPEKCIGCGICEHECPVKDHRAIRVSAAGETRSPDNSIILTS